MTIWDPVAASFRQDVPLVLKAFRFSQLGPPQTLGQHLRAKRKELGLSQIALAIRFGVCEETIYLWEWDRVRPEAGQFPGIVGFLGYDPLPAPRTLGEKIRRRRFLLGVSQKEAAKLLKVSELTLSRYENGKPVSRERSERVEAYLESPYQIR